MWSAIPVALLCMVVNQNERHGSRTQGIFVRPSIHPTPQALSGLKSALSGLKSALSGLESEEGVDRRTDGRTDGRTNKQNKFPVFYRTLSPSGPLPCLSF